MKNIPLFSTYIHPTAREQINDVLTSTFLSEGKVVKEFETKLATVLGWNNPVAVFASHSPEIAIVHDISLAIQLLHHCNRISMDRVPFEDWVIRTTPFYETLDAPATAKKISARGAFLGSRSAPISA